MADYHPLSAPHQDELAYQVHYMLAVTTPRNEGLELANAPMIPLISVAPDLTRSEDQLSLKAG